MALSDKQLAQILIAPCRGGILQAQVFSKCCRRILGRAIFDIGGCCGPCAVGTAEKVTANFYSMPNYSALAMFTNGGDGLNRTLKAVEYMPCSCSYQLKTLVVLVPANFACCHIPPP
jgi:hypothetical protein